MRASPDCPAFTPSLSGGSRKGLMGDTVAGAGERVGDVGPGVDTATSAGFDDAEFGGIGGASLFGARAEAEAAGDDGVPQGAFCLVVCRRQQRIADEGDDGGPVVEDFPGELADFLGVVIAMELARPLEPGLDRVEDGMVLVVYLGQRSGHSGGWLSGA